MPVKDTPFDFSEPTAIAIAKGMELEKTNEQLKRGPGFDHCWVLNEQDTGMLLPTSQIAVALWRFLQMSRRFNSILGISLTVLCQQKVAATMKDARDSACIPTLS